MQMSENIGWKMKMPKVEERPAIVIAAFGSSRRGKAALDSFDEKARHYFQNHRIYWGYTSKIIREKTGTPSLHEVLAKVEADGYRKAVVLPLQIFPGAEYRDISETALNFPGLRIMVGETLMHRWEFVEDVLEVVAEDFLPPEEGLNFLALHGTSIVADPVNSGYLGFAQLAADKYPNVLAASLEGVPDAGAVLARIERENLADRFERLRIIPMMFIAGLHVEDDLMGRQKSWKSRLEGLGFAVECNKINLNGEEYYKSLASYNDIQRFYIERIERALKLMDLY